MSSALAQTIEQLPVDQLENITDAPDGADVDVEGLPEEGDAQAPICFHPEAKLSTRERREDTAAVCVDRFHQYRDCQARRRIDKTMVYCYKAYMGFKPDGADDVWVIRSIFRIMELLKSISSRAFFGGDRLFTVKPRIVGGEDYAEGATSIMHDHIRRSESRGQLGMWHDNAWMYGTSCMTDSWQKFKLSRMKQGNPFVDQELSQNEQPSNEVLAGMPRFQYLPLTDCYSHPNIENPRESPAFYRSMTVSMEDVKTLMREGWADQAETEKFIAENSGGYRDDDHRSIIEKIWGDDIERSVAREGAVYELLICQTFNGWEFGVLNNKHLIRAMPLQQGKIPIYCLRNYPQQQEFYAVPEIFLMLEDSRLSNEMTRLWYLTNYYSAPMWSVQAGMEEIYDAGAFQPGGRVIRNKPDDIVPLQCAKNAFDYQGSIEYIISKMEGTSGATKELAGLGGQKTASSTQMMLTQAQARQNRKVELWTPEFENAYGGYYDQEAWNNNDEEIDMRVAGADGADAFKRYDGTKVFTPSVDIDIEIGNDGDPGQIVPIQNSIKMLGPEDEREEWMKELRKAHGFKHDRRFRKNILQNQGDVLKLKDQLEVTGVIDDPKPSDPHEIWVQVLKMWMDTPVFATLPITTQERAKGIFQVHMNFVMQAQAANAQAQQAATALPGPGATPVQAAANQDAQNRFGMAETGAAQAGEMMP